MLSEPNQSPMNVGPGGGPPLVDLTAALERMEGDIRLLHEVVDIFLEDYQVCMDEVRLAVQTLDTNLLQRAVHTMKGAVGNFVSAKATDIARDMEHFCKQGEIDSAIALCDVLESAVAEVAAELRKFRCKEAA